jgi:hypothetical protein
MEKMLPRKIKIKDMNFQTEETDGFKNIDFTKIKNIKEYPKSVIIHEMKVKHKKKYSIPRMIPSLLNIKNLKKQCNSTFHEKLDEGRGYHENVVDFHKIKCNFIYSQRVVL